MMSAPTAPQQLAERLTTAERFHRLAAEWKHQSRYMSNLRQAVMLRPYQAIIGMGFPAVRLMLEDLQKHPAHWFWALEVITGENPVPEEARGNVAKMAEAWIDWGKRVGVVSCAPHGHAET
jgi:hypothetical protein